MATPVTMPRQGQSVETCIITSWFKKRGEKVRAGDLLFSYETDKAAFDFESPDDGILLEIFFNEGDEVPVLVNVAVIGNEGEETQSFRPSAAAEKTSPAGGEASMPEEAAAASAVTAQAEGGRIRISPRARMIASQKGIDLTAVPGSGPGGRIVVKDIELAGKESRGKSAAAARTEPGAKKKGGQLPAGEYSDQPLSNVRRLISKAMHSSLQNSAQLTHHMSADVRSLMEARKKIKSEISSGTDVQDITLNDMICWCVIRALQQFPEMNSHFLDDRTRTFGNVHLGIAVDTARGLMVPAVRNAEKLDIIALSAALRKVSEACRKGNVDPELLKSTAASFTVSNLGSYGVEMFTPVINLPQAGILGVCTITHRPADLGNGVFGFIPVMGLSLTYDHRAVDGGPATLFLKEIKNNIEHFNI